MKFCLKENNKQWGFTMKNVLLVLPFIFFFACSDDTDSSNNSGTFIDTRDGKTYMYVQIGKQVWFAENLNYNASGSKCYGENGQTLVGENEYAMLSDEEVQANCAKYGRLYDWSTAMDFLPNCNSNTCTDQIQQPNHQGICPSGWHIPKNADWDKLLLYVDNENGYDESEESFYQSLTAGKYLKSATGWNDYQGKSGNGTDNYNFSALPGGTGNRYGHFGNAGFYGYWWSASEDDNYAIRRRMSYNGEYISGAHYDKSELISVRCVKD